MIDLVSIQSRSLQAKREAVKLLSDHADPDALTETVKLLADPAPDIALAEAIKPLAEHAAKELDAEKLLGEAIGILAGSCDFGEQLREVLKRLAQHADTEQLRAAILV